MLDNVLLNSFWSLKSHIVLCNLPVLVLDVSESIRELPPVRQFSLRMYFWHIPATANQSNHGVVLGTYNVKAHPSHPYAPTPQPIQPTRKKSYRNIQYFSVRRVTTSYKISGTLLRPPQHEKPPIAWSSNVSYSSTSTDMPSANHCNSLNSIWSYCLNSRYWQTVL